jgi:N-acetylglucosamine-6-phosphate deacetylase
MLTQIINARILTPQGWLKDGSVLIRDNKILEVTNCDLAIIGAKLIDAKGMYIVPGGVEIHVHGGGGRDFMEGTEEAFRTAIKAHMQHGTTSIFPTLSSSTIPMIRAAAATTEKMMAEPNSPVLGLHLEGHYFNMDMADSGKYQRSRSRRIYSVIGRNTLYQTLGCRTGTSRSHAIR